MIVALSGECNLFGVTSYRKSESDAISDRVYVTKLTGWKSCCTRQSLDGLTRTSLIRGLNAVLRVK